MRSLIKSVIEILKQIDQREFKPYFVVGFDGYVDRIQKVIRHKDGDTKIYFDTISELADYEHNLAGRSGQIELETRMLKLGGNGPILANALAHLGVPNRLYGTLGESALHPVFNALHEQVTCQSLGQPAETNALEFEDGKLIFSEVSPFETLSWEGLLSRVGEEQIRADLVAADGCAFVDWANLPYGTDLWQGLLDLMRSIEDPPRFVFFDLCDPSKRTSASVIEVLECMARFSEVTEVILGLNENEARNVYQRLMDTTVESLDLERIGEEVCNRIGIDQFLIHPVDGALLATKRGIIMKRGRVVQQPKLLTGAGDNLNAGFCLAKTLGMSAEQQLICAMAASGAYVANGFSPGRRALIDYLELWQQELPT